VLQGRDGVRVEHIGHLRFRPTCRFLSLPFPLRRDRGGDLSGECIVGEHACGGQMGVPVVL